MPDPQVVPSADGVKDQQYPSLFDFLHQSLLQISLDLN